MAAIALRYALAPACAGVAMLLHSSPVGAFFHPMGLFILGVLAAAWFGGAGPGVLAAFLSAAALPHLVVNTFPLLAGYFDLPRFIALGLTGAAVGWGRASYLQLKSVLRDKRRAEEALKTSDERYSLALAASDEGHFDIDVDTDRIFTSERYNVIHGFAPDARFKSRADLVRQTRYYGDDFKKYLAVVKTIVAENAPDRVQFEYRVLWPNGEVHWVRVSCKSSRDAQGRVRRRTGVATDITEEKLAEEALRESQERYELAMAASESGYWDWHIPTGLYFSSARASEMVGLPAENTYTDRNDFRARIPVHPEDWARWDAAREALFAGTGERLAMEVRYIIGGETRWHSFQAICKRDEAGNVVRWTGSTTDVTERKLAQEALRLSSERDAVALEVSQEGTWEWNVRTDAFYASPQTLRVYGLPADVKYRTRTEALGMARVYPEDLPRVSEGWRAALAGQGARYAFEYRILVGDETRWVRTRWKIFRDDSGAAQRVIGVVVDITARKLAEESQRSSQQGYALAMEAAQDAHWDWNVITGEYRISPSMFRLYDFPEGTKIATREDFMAVWPMLPEYREAWLRASAELLAGTGDRLSMLLQARIRGDIRLLQFNGACIRDAAGKAIRFCGSVRDETDRIRAEESLRRSEQSYALAMEAAQDSHWDWNMVTGEYYVSPSTVQLLGFPEGTKFTTREEHLAISPYLPEDSEAWVRATEELFAGTGDRLSMEQRASVRGEIRWFQRTGFCKRDAAGKPIRWSGTVRDVTDRKRSEQALQLSEGRYALAMEAAGDGHTDWDLQTGEHYVSPRLLEICGYAPGTTFRDRSEWVRRFPFHPEDRPKWENAIAAHFAGHESHFKMELRIIVRGEVRWTAFHFLSTRDSAGKPIRWTGSIGDITERKRIEEELRSRQEMLDVAQKAARVTAFEWRGDAAKGVNVWPPDLEAMHGLEPGGYDGSIKGWKRLIYPEDLATVNEAMARAERTGDIALEYRVVHPDQSVHWVQTRGRMFIDAAGRAARIVGFAQEITQSKQAEADLRKMEEELRRAQRLESMGTLAGGIAHDFNNVLGAILGYGEMAMRYARKGTRLRNDMESILAAGERGRALVDQILAFSRSGVAERIPVHVSAVVREALDQIAASLPDDVTIVPRLRAGRAAVLGDSTQVHQVVMNLAANAAQAMPEGGTLRVSLETQRIEAPRAALVGTIAAGEHVVLKVTDAGTGIRPGVLERMFDPFYTTKEVGVGSGLGLSLVHGIVTSVGGAIDVATEIGRGTTFTVYFRRFGDVPEEGPADKSRPLPRGEGQRVLVVDDEEPLVRLATKTLEDLGYSPTGFTSSAAALDAFRADPQRFDALLTDERMPGLSGSALIREVRRIRGGVPVVLMSGYLGMKSVDADVVMRKPVSARDLATSMAQVLDS
jgi:PAS domain S-box-containing protein